MGKALVAIATESEATAESFHREHSEMGAAHRYFRFNVIQGLEDVMMEDASQRNTVVAASRRYAVSQRVYQDMKYLKLKHCEGPSDFFDAN